MILLKQMSWNDDWKECIKNADHAASLVHQVLPVMIQLENKMPVYDAFLKGLEIYYSSTTCGKESFLREYRRLQNTMYKNMKKGVVDEFLVDFHSAMIKAGRKWC